MNNKEIKKVIIRNNFWTELKEKSEKYVHIIMIGTKPDIIKQAPLYLELKKRGLLTVLIHTSQHYDYILSKGVLDEFGMNVDIELNISGDLHKKYSLIVDRLGTILVEMQRIGKKPIPYVHGDTLTATTASKAAFVNKIAVVHVEAGIRTLTPNKDFYYNLFTEFEKGNFNWENYHKSLQNRNIYELGSIEPYPEQFDTRGILASTGLYAAPVELNKETLIGEGTQEKYIKVVGNTAVDAINISKEKISNSKAFQYFPNMKGKPFIFVTIHRRENTEIKERFLAIYYGLKKLIENGVYVCFLGLNASETAIDRYNLRDDIGKLIIKYKENFAYGKPLAHHHEVIDMLMNCGALVTDSGSMQEEANILQIPCVTVRFGSDRAETFLNGSNIIAPPVNSNLIYKIVKGAIGNKNMIKKEYFYGKNVSEKIVNEVLKALEKDQELFRLDHIKLELKKFFNYEI